MAPPRIGGVAAALALAGLSLHATVSNDAFATPTPLSGGRGVLTCTNVGATKEPGEPNHAGKRGGASIWFRWTAPASGSVTVDTEGSEFDTLLAVYTGTTVSSLTPVASNNDISRDILESRLAFNAQAGTIYQIAVDGNGSPAPAGWVVLTWYPTNPTNAAPTNDDFTAAVPLPASLGAVTASTVRATRELNEPFHANVPCGRSVWYRWTAPAHGIASFHSLQGDFDTILAAYQGPALSSLIRLDANNDVDNLTRQSRVTFRTVAGTEYRLALDGVATRSGVIREGTAVLHGVFQPGAGDNDRFANAQVLEGPHGRTYGVNRDATKEPGEPQHAGNVGGKSVWYRWTAPATGPVFFDLRGTIFENAIMTFVLLAVYTGEAVHALTPVTDNFDPDTAGYHPSVSFHAVAGTTYHVAVDGYFDAIFSKSTAAGTIVLSWSQGQAARLGAPRVLPSGGFDLSVSAPPDRLCTVEATTNFATWTECTNFTAPDTPLRITVEPAVRSRAGRFYRVRLGP